MAEAHSYQPVAGAVTWPLLLPVRHLFAGIERVANRADFHVNVALVGRTGLKTVSAGALNLHCGVIGMNLFLGHRSEQTFPAMLLL
jgi:hypothetical protein